MSDRRNVLELFESQKNLIEERLQYGIENYRKGDGEISVFDKNGKPVENAQIKVVQKTHAFRFGANIFMLDELENEEKNELYKKYFKVFNMATLPFYWSDLEPEQGKPRYDKNSPKIYRRPPIDLCIEFCEKNNIEPREHALAYEHFFPSWLADKSNEEVKKEFERRCSEISERYKDKIRTIEVTNEMGWPKGVTKFFDAPDFVEFCFKTAEKYFPENQLVINEYTGDCWGDICRTTAKYYSYAEANMLRGAKIDAIGLQYHMFYKREQEYDSTRGFYSPENLYKHMDLYANLNKPLQLTEVTIPAYSNSAEDEAIQAEIIEYLYKIWFSHKNVEQIMYWNLVDGYAAFAPQGDMTSGENYYYGGLIRFDLTPKPAYYAIKNLFEKTWHTEENLISDNSGKTSFRGFYGDYEVTVNGKTASVTLSKDGNNHFAITI